ncbi:DUF1194 domain-containing protein [Paracoccus sp. (in: a-proteobacteria)]|uniref:DUF1194 domain-containing protein n=1 Tax=Paracoccus sp. TaxID=267 RepID=UPI003A889A6A
MKVYLASALLASTLALSSLNTASAATVVDTELSLLIDVSGSVNTTEFNLQRQGYVDAFRDTAIQNLITDTDGGTRLGNIAVNVVYWASSAVEVLPWTLINSAATANSFADTLNGLTSRAGTGNSTAPGTAINYALNSLNANDFDGNRVVIDVSGDGSENTGANTAAARDAAIAGGVDRINGIAILDGYPSLETWYNDNIKGGTNGFVLTANDFNDFGNAIRKKLGYEIANSTPAIPLPAAIWLLGGAVGGLGLMRRRSRG